MLEKSLVEELLNYNPESGQLIWREKTETSCPDDKSRKWWNARYAGTVAGSMDEFGYIRVRIVGKRYRAHRLIWLLTHGVEPQCIDHIDGNRANNRLNNLRDVDAIDNNRNSSIGQLNTSGHLGVTWFRQTSKWRAQIKVGKRTLHLGFFERFEDAVEARKNAEAEHGFHENHGKKTHR